MTVLIAVFITGPKSQTLGPVVLNLLKNLTAYPDLVPLREVASWQSYLNVVATIGRSLGGPLGGWLADTIGWRWYAIPNWSSGSSVRSNGIF